MSSSKGTIVRAFYFTRDENLATKPEVLQIRRATGLSAADVVFHIEEFWRYVNQLGCSLNNASGVGILPGYELADLPLLVGLNDAYWSAVVSVGWIELSPDGELLIPGFDARFGKLAQRRMAATRRQQRSRANKSSREAAMPSPDLRRPDTTQQKGRQAQQPRREASGSQQHAATNQTAPAQTEPITPVASEQRATAPITSAEPAQTPSTVTTIAPARSTKTPVTSQFDLLTVSDLAVCGKLLCWMADIATMPRPVVLNDAWHQVRVIAAGIRATAGVGVKEPLALFKSIVGKARWTMLEPEDLKTAQLRLSNYQRGALTLHADIPNRAGPDCEAASAATLLANGFGTIPQPARQPGAAELLQWDRQRKSRTG